MCLYLCILCIFANGTHPLVKQIILQTFLEMSTSKGLINTVHFFIPFAPHPLSFFTLSFLHHFIPLLIFSFIYLLLHPLFMIVCPFPLQYHFFSCCVLHPSFHHYFVSNTHYLESHWLIIFKWLLSYFEATHLYFLTALCHCEL